MNIKIFYNTGFVPTPEFTGKPIDTSELNYEMVWQGTPGQIDFILGDDIQNLEGIFDYFNRRKPKNFIGQFRSLSIGDVICLDDKFYICQTQGWRQLEEIEVKRIKEL